MTTTEIKREVQDIIDEVLTFLKVYQRHREFPPTQLMFAAKVFMSLDLSLHPLGESMPAADRILEARKDLENMRAAFKGWGAPIVAVADSYEGASVVVKGKPV